VAQKEKALLGNLQVSKNIGPESKTLTLPEVEEELEKIIKVNGEAQINKVRTGRWILPQSWGWKMNLKSWIE
jgi:hypothetical protein